MSDMLTNNFSREEFACSCGCGNDNVDLRLVELLQRVRDHFQAPVRINSGCRCYSHNLAVEGSSGSQHLYGTAADIAVEGVPAVEVQDWLEALDHEGGLGSYETFTHVDVRKSRARWNG